MDGQKKRNQSNETIEKWLLLFLDGLITLTQQLTTKREQYKAVKGYLNERQKQVIEIVKEQRSTQITDLMKVLPNISRSTLKNDIALLIERRLLIALGKGRGVRYFVPDAL